MKRVTMEIQYEDGNTELRQFEDGTFSIGRDEGDIALRNAIVSGRHGELKVTGSSVVYTDQGSTNGTYTADGKRLEGPHPLAQGAELKIGACVIRLKAIHQPTAATMLQSAFTVDDQAHAKTVLGQPAVQVPVGVPKVVSPPAVSPGSTAGAESASSVPPRSASSPPSGAGASVPAEAALSVSSVAPKNNPDRGLVELSSPGAGQEDNQHRFDAGDGFTYNLDVGALVNTPMKDPQWIVKCAIIGLLSLIPIAGAINLAGWLVACYNNRKNGSDELPIANFSYIGSGMNIFMAYLPAIGAVIGINIILGIVTFILPFLFFLSPLVNLAAGAYLLVSGPAIMYLTIERNMTWTSIRIAEILRFAKSNSQAYTSLVIAFLVASLVGGAGSIVLIGSIITIPFSVVMQAKILADIK